jgi:hypothetical protein
MILVVGVAGEVATAMADKASGGLIEVYKTGGIVAVLLILLAVVYFDAKKQREKTEALYAKAAEASVAQAQATQAHSDATRTQAAAIFDMSKAVKTVIRDCAQRRGMPLDTVEAPDVQRPT